MTWATKEPFDFVKPDPDPTCGGLVPVIPFPDDGPVYVGMHGCGHVKYPWDMEMHGCGHVKCPWDKSEIDELRREIKDMHRKILELREDIRRALASRVYPRTMIPYPEPAPKLELVDPKGRIKGTKWPFSY